MAERDSLLATIDYLLDRVTEKSGPEVAMSALNTHNPNNLETLSIGELWDVVGNLQQIDAE